jgi:hypothetical protein
VLDSSGHMNSLQPTKLLPVGLEESKWRAVGLLGSSLLLRKQRRLPKTRDCEC